MNLLPDVTEPDAFNPPVARGNYSPAARQLIKYRHNIITLIWNKPGRYKEVFKIIG
jgi:hypothetical protein